MKLRYKTGIGFLGVLEVAVTALALVLSNNSPCSEPPAVAAGEESMHAAVYTCYGGPDVLEIVTLAKPVPAENEVLVRVHAAEGDQRYDLVVDMVGNHSISANRSVITDNGRYVIVGGPPGKWLGPMVRPIGAAIQNQFTDQELVMLLARIKKDDLEVLADAMAAAQLTAMIDRHFTLAELPEAIRHSETGRARGKIIIDLR